MAAPVGGQILSEVLPYLELQKDNEKEEDKKEEIVMPEIRGKSLKEAMAEVKEQELEIVVNGVEDIKTLNKEETILKEQLPKPGIKVVRGTKIYVDI